MTGLIIGGFILFGLLLILSGVIAVTGHDKLSTATAVLAAVCMSASAILAVLYANDRDHKCEQSNGQMIRGTCIKKDSVIRL